MYLQVLAHRFYKVMKMKSVKSSLILKVTRLSQHQAIRLADFGAQKPAMRFSALASTLAKATKMKYSHVLLTMRETLLLRAQKIIPAAFGKTLGS